MGWIERFGHGGDRDTAAESFGIDRDRLLDFSANINPLGPPHALMEKLKQDLDQIIHYPDPAQRTFRQKLARHLQVDERMILPGNGAAECMALAILGLSVQKVGVIYPCFSEYEKLARAFGASVSACYGRQERDYKPDMEELYPLFQEQDLVFVGHPNNPTGILYSLDELRTMAAWADETETYLVVDEAFLDFLPPEEQITLLPELNRYPRVILIRSLTKFYAIPGLRLGYTVADPDLIKKMKAKQVTWSVNQFALSAGEVCLDQREYEEKTRRLVETERDYLIRKIRDGLGWQVWPGKANFLMVRLPVAITADALQLAFGQKGIMIRNLSMYPGLTPYDIRIAVRLREENDRFLQTLNEVLEEAKWGDRV
ncbi:MAG: threonine-phosphate decarboxylase [Bacillaceae bacterium]|nr:threonine-phosphate decarboxylase [Bacillaceae bacterium]